MRRAFIRFLWKALLGIIALVVASFAAIWFGLIGYMPDIEELQNPISRSATQVFSADGQVIGTWNYNRENRILVSYNNLSPHLVHALVATEDERFYEHSGIDFIALGRAIVKRGILGQASAGGGSTITQQLAKQLYSETAHSKLERLLQKPIEWVIAVKLERNYTKEEIISLYLNYFDFLHNAVGIKRTPRFSTLFVILTGAVIAAMWCFHRCRRQATCRKLNVQSQVRNLLSWTSIVRITKMEQHLISASSFVNI